MTFLLNQQMEANVLPPRFKKKVDLWSMCLPNKVYILPLSSKGRAFWFCNRDLAFCIGKVQLIIYSLLSFFTSNKVGVEKEKVM
jgi:hypothetical protein